MSEAQGKERGQAALPNPEPLQLAQVYRIECLASSLESKL